jgi:hypothetical protein
MIPWFIVSIADRVAVLFGYQVYVTAKSGNWWGAERVHFIRNPDAKRMPKLKLKPWDGSPLEHID